MPPPTSPLTRMCPGFLGWLLVFPILHLPLQSPCRRLDFLRELLASDPLMGQDMSLPQKWAEVGAGEAVEVVEEGEGVLEEACWQ